MKKLWVLFLCLGLVGCATANLSPSKEEAFEYVANFSYTPPTQAAPGSAGVTFTVGNLSCEYHPKTDIVVWPKSAQLANLFDAMRQDLTKLLTAKGFSVRGPFDSYDLVPFPDKKAIDLWMVPTLEISVTGKNMKDDYANFMLISRASTGNVEVTGKLTLELKEIVSRELMWSKVIPLEKFGFPYRIQYALGKPGGLIFHNKIMNEVAKEIEKQYPDLMATVYKLIDPEEMRMLKKQCQKLKSKKGY